MNWLFSFLNTYGFPAMLLLVLLEYACFPVSSEIVLPFCGALAAARGISYPLLVLLSACAGLIGTTLCYAVGWFGGIPLLSRIMKRFPKTKKGICVSTEFFNKRGAILVLIGRFIPICRTYLGFVAGTLKLGLLQYLIYSFFGILAWNALLCGLGFLLKSHWPLVTSWYTRYRNLLIPALLLLLLFWIWMRSRSKSKSC